MSAYKNFLNIIYQFELNKKIKNKKSHELRSEWILNLKTLKPKILLNFFFSFLGRIQRTL